MMAKGRAGVGRQFSRNVNDLFGEDGWIMKVMKEATNKLGQ